MGCEGNLFISMPRGDVVPLEFDIYESDGETITQMDFDDIFFTVKKNFTDRNYKFQKRLSDGNIVRDRDWHYHILIDAEDTNYLPFGDYVFDIELVKHNLTVPDIKQTIVGKLILSEESTYASNEE